MMKPAKSPLETNRRHVAREAMVNTLDWLLRNPMSAPEVWGAISSGSVVDKSQVDGSSVGGGDTGGTAAGSNGIASTFGKCSVHVKATVYARLPGGPDITLMDLIDDVDRMAVHDMFRMHFQVEHSDKVPEAAQDLAIFVQMMVRRGAEVGDRWKVFFESAVDSAGVVDWAKAPLFSMAYTEVASLKTVTHFSGAIGVPSAHVQIHRSWLLYDPCSDEGARFEPTEDDKLFVRTFFEKHEGPNEFRLDKAGKHMALLATAAKTLVETKKKSILDISMDDAVVKVDKRVARLRRESLEKARAARQNSTPHKKARTLKLCDMPAATMEAAVVMEPEGAALEELVEPDAEQAVGIGGGSGDEAIPSVVGAVAGAV